MKLFRWFRRAEQVELRRLQPGDRFKMFDLESCPEQELIAKRAPDIDMSSDHYDVQVALFAEVYTLRRVDGAWPDPYDITLNAFDTVTRTWKGPR